MPELPEVETIVRRLRNGTSEHPPVPGHTIQSVEVTWDRIVAEPNVITFKEALLGKEIINVRRRGKFLHFPLNQGHLIAHLRMSGDMRMEKRIDEAGNLEPSDAYDRATFNFITAWRLAFNNIRKFGRLWFVNDPQSIFDRLGLEPLSNDFSPLILHEKLQNHHRQIKPLLMDQQFIAGLGNIYTDESLFRARIHPLRKSDSLSMAEATALHNAIRTVLQEGIQNFGSSLDWVYRGGEFQNHFNVYQRTGQPCPICGTPIQKTTIGQRGTHFCPNCQQNDPDT
jgi:formamidopyrimidine-DNA glycosylase